MSYHNSSRRQQPYGYQPRQNGHPMSVEAPRAPEPTFILDRYGANPRSPFQVPRYRVINEVPLPCKRSEQGLIKDLLRCFNCGAKDHKLSDCSQTTGLKFDREIVNMNKGWMNQYARIGAKRRRENFNARYFVDPKKGKALDDISSSSNASKRKEKEPTPPPALHVWNTTKDVEDAISSAAEEANKNKPPNRRRDNRPAPRDRGNPQSRERGRRGGGEYDRDVRKYQQQPSRGRNQDRPRGNHQMNQMNHRGQRQQGSYGHGPPPNQYQPRHQGYRQNGYQNISSRHGQGHGPGPRSGPPRGPPRHSPPNGGGGYGHQDRRNHRSNYRPQQRRNDRSSGFRPRGQNYEF